jgi:hypothetical protein
VVSATDHLRSVMSVFYAGALFLRYLLIYPHEAEWSPFQTQCYSENLVAPGMEPGTSVRAARNYDR